MLGGLL